LWHQKNEKTMLNSKSIGNKIATARKKINLSQAELAEQVSISPQAVGKWERGESVPDIFTLNRLAAIFGVDLNYFSDTYEEKEVGTPHLAKMEAPVQAEAQTKTGKKFDWNWDMSEGNWSDADFSGLKNLKEKFSASNMKHCKFRNADLSGLMLGKNNIDSCDFSNADIRDSKIQSSNLLNNLFNNCSFIDATFYKSNIEACDFSGSDFSGAEILEVNLERVVVNDVCWKFTKFQKSNLSGILEDCHFEHCGFYGVKFENATLLNSFFKYNERFKKVQFVNCKVDSITFAFLKNNRADLSGITIIP
jgi:uncharacterized protein YjbI with pentapeptide repeats